MTGEVHVKPWIPLWQKRGNPDQRMSCVLFVVVVVEFVVKSHSQSLTWSRPVFTLVLGKLLHCCWRIDKMQVVITVFLVALVFPMCLVARTGFFGCHFITALAIYAQALDPASPYPLQDFSIIIRPHRSTTYVDAACCYRPSSVVCLSVCHTSEPCRNSCTDRDAVWVEDSGGPKKPCIRWGPVPPMGRGNFDGGSSVLRDAAMDAICYNWLCGL